MVTPTPTVSQFGSIIVARWPGEFSQFCLLYASAGRVVVDISGEEKKKLTVPDLLALFSRASGSEEADDKLLLS